MVTAARVISVSLAVLALNSQAATIYWDGGTVNIATNGDGISQGGGGTWGDRNLNNWDAGSGVSHRASTRKDTAVFGGTAGTVTLASGQTITGLSFITDGYTLTGANTLLIKGGGITASGNTTVSVLTRLAANQTWSVVTGKMLKLAGTVDTNNRVLTYSTAGSAEVSGIVSGGGNVTKSGVGTLTITAANTYTGSTTLSGGVVNLGVAQSSSTSGPMGRSTAAGSILFNGGTLQYSSANTYDYSSRFSTAGGQSWRIDTNGQSVSYATILAGASSLAKSGSGTLTLTRANTYTGGTTVSGGTLEITGTLADTGAVTVSGGTLTVGATDTVGAVTLVSGTINGTGILTGASYAVQSGAVSAILSGTGALTKTTAGTVTLAGMNSYTGGTTISAGILNVTGGLADTGAVTVSGGATYTVGVNDTVGAVTLTSGTINGAFALTGSSFNVQSGTVSANLAGVNSLTKSTGGVVTLSGTNTYTGATTISAGNLVVNGSLSTGSNVSLAGGAVLSGTGNLGGTVTVANDPTAEVMVGDGIIGKLTIGNLTFSGAGTIHIGTLGNYTGADNNVALAVTSNLTLTGGAGAVNINLPSGVLSNGTYHLISHSNTLANLTGFTVTGPAVGGRQSALLVNNGTLIDYVVSGDSPYWTGATNSAWDPTTSNWKLIVGTGDTQFIAGDAVLFDDSAARTAVDLAANVGPAAMSFTNATKDYLVQSTGGFAITSGTLTKSGAGILTISNANTYNGGTTLNAGVLQVGNDSALGTGTLVFNGGTLSADSTASRTLANPLSAGGDFTLGDSINNGALTFSGALDLGVASRQITTASNVTLAGIVSNGALVKAGAGTLALFGANTYTGGTTLSAGTLAVNSSSSLGAASGALTFAGNGTLQMAANASSSRSFLINSGVTGTVDTNGFALTHSGVISGSGALTKTGAGTLTLSGTNAFTGATQINGGTLALAGGAALVDTAAVTLASGATLQLNAGETIGSLSGGGTVELAANTLTVGDANTTSFGGVITGTGALTKLGEGALVLTGSNTYSGVTTLTAGTLSIAADSGLGAAPGTATPGKLVLNGGTLATTSTFTLNSNRGITTGGSIDVGPSTTLTYGGIAAGSGALTKTGEGTLVMSGANSHTGATTISGGSLFVSGSLAAGSAVTVGSLGTLAGTGTVAGSVTGEDNATFVAGNGVTGKLTVGGNLTLQGDATIQIGTLSGYTSTAALVVTGSLLPETVNGSVVTFSLPTGALANGTYHLASHDNNINASDFNKAFAVSGPTVGARQAATLTNNTKMIDYIVTGDTPYWTGSVSGAWDTTSNNWKLVVGGGVTQFQASDTVLFNDNATNTTVNLVANVNPVVSSFTNATKDYLVQSTGGFGITTGSLTKSGAGILTITNANTYNEGTTLSGGILRVGNNDALGTGLVTLAGGTLSANSATARTLSNALVIGGDVMLGDATNNGALTFSGTVDLDGVTRQLTIASDVKLSGGVFGTLGGLSKAGSGTLTLTGTNTYTGATAISAGTLQLGDGTTNGTLASASAISNSGAFIYNLTGGSSTFANDLSGSGTFEKNGSGTLTLTGAKTYTGQTTVSGGALAVNGSLASLTTVVAPAATLMGTGSLAGTTTVSGTHSPGNSIGLQTFENLVYNSTTVFSWEMNYAAGSEGTRAINYDGVNVSGTFTGANAEFRIVIPSGGDFSSTFWDADRQWTDIFQTNNSNWGTIFTTNGTTNFQFYSGDSPLSTPTSGTFTLSGSTLSWSAVPEPTSALVGILLGAGLLRRHSKSITCAATAPCKIRHADKP